MLSGSILGSNKAKGCRLLVTALKREGYNSHLLSTLGTLPSEVVSELGQQRGLLKALTGSPTSLALFDVLFVSLFGEVGHESRHHLQQPRHLEDLFKGDARAGEPQHPERFDGNNVPCAKHHARFDLRPKDGDSFFFAIVESGKKGGIEVFERFQYFNRCRFYPFDLAGAFLSFKVNRLATIFRDEELGLVNNCCWHLDFVGALELVPNSELVCKNDDVSIQQQQFRFVHR